MNCEYARKHYGVPARIGRRVTYRGRPGIIAKDRGSYIGVNFDGDKPGVWANIHPTDPNLIYLDEIGEVRPMTRSQKRYQRYIEIGDGFRSFLDFCRWYDKAQRR